MADPDNSVLEAARKRARRRLVGAVMLALAAAVVLPIFLESDPQPLGPDVQIQIPAIDDAKFQNRLTPAVPADGAAAEQSAPLLSSEPMMTSKSTDSGTVAASVVKAPTAKKPELPAPTPPALSVAKPDQRKSTTAPAAAAVSALPPTSVKHANVSPKPTSASPEPSAATRPAATATTPLAAAPARKPAAAAPAPNQATAAVPAASLPAFSLTATAPPLGAPASPDSKSALNVPPPKARGEFVVQLGAYIDSAVAADLAAKAGAQGFSAFLEAVTTSSGRVQRVRVGPFATRGEADAVAAKLKAAGFTAVARPR